MGILGAAWITALVLGILCLILAPLFESEILLFLAGVLTGLCLLTGVVAMLINIWSNALSP